MFAPAGAGNPSRTTNYKVVLPFYLFATVSFIVGCVLLFTSTESLTVHYFNPHVLAITHTMALAWGTMMILGAGHQLIPVLIEEKLHSDLLGFLCFGFASVGMIALIWAFYHNDFGVLAQFGGTAILIGFSLFVANVLISMIKGNKFKDVHAKFILLGSLWMLATIIVGVLLLFNFEYSFLSKNSLHYLPLHAHFGIVGWFLMIVLGVGSRLIPMFLISKYSNPKRLETILVLVNLGLLLFTISFLLQLSSILYFISILLIVVGVILFAKFCFRAHKERIRKTVETQLKVSIFSSIMMLIPAIVLIGIIALSNESKDFSHLGMIYGFLIFFGWITAIIFGMTFKTLPFILWNKKFHKKASAGETPNPKDLFNQKVFDTMILFYFTGFIIFVISIPLTNLLMLKIGAAFLVITSLLYNYNVFRMVFFKK